MTGWSLSLGRVFSPLDVCSLPYLLSNLSFWSHHQVRDHHVRYFSLKGLFFLKPEWLNTKINDCNTMIDTIKPCRQKLPSTGIGASHFNWLKDQCRRFPISVQVRYKYMSLALIFFFIFFFCTPFRLRIFFFSSPAGFMIFQGYQSESETFPALRLYFGLIDAHGLDFVQEL